MNEALWGIPDEAGEVGGERGGYSGLSLPSAFLHFSQGTKSGLCH